MDFDIGSGLVGLYQVANVVQDVHFHGERYGILTEKPSAAWQFTCSIIQPSMGSARRG